MTVKIATVDRYLHIPSNSRLGPAGAQGEQPATQAAVFLDRDGVVVEDVHYLRNPAQLRILPGVFQALRALQERFYIIVVTNQSGIARGFLTEDDLFSIHLELVWRLTTEEAILDALYYCPYLPQKASARAYQVECNCRKPNQGMLLQAKRDWDIDMTYSYIVGDSLRDIEAGTSVGVEGILVAREGESLAGAQASVLDLSEAARLVLFQNDT